MIATTLTDTEAFFRDYLLYFGAWLLCAIIGAALGSTAKKTGLGFALGTLLGPLGLLITAIMVLGQRPAQPTIIYMQAPTPSAPTTIPTPATQHNPIAQLPDNLTIAREGTILGTWPLADVSDYLTTGHLTPTDHYQTPAGHWRPLSKSGLTA